MRFDLRDAGAPPDEIERRMAELDQAGILWVLPEHWDAWLLYRGHHTQWIVGPGGAVGLNYQTLYMTMDRQGLSPERQLELIGQVQQIEEGILAERAEQRAESSSQ